MSTQVRDPVVTGGPERAGGRRWIVVLVVGLLAAAMGLGVGYLVFSPGSDSEVNADVQTLLDDYTTAANAGDADAVLALLTDDAHFFTYDLAQTPEPTVRRSIEGWAGLVEAEDGLTDIVVTGTGDLPPYRVAAPGLFGGDEYLYIFTIEQVDGELLFSYIDTVDAQE